MQPGKALCFSGMHVSILPIPPFTLLCPQGWARPRCGLCEGALTFMGAEPIQEPYLVEAQSGRFGVVGARMSITLFFFFLTVNDSKFISCNSSTTL